MALYFLEVLDGPRGNITTREDVVLLSPRLGQVSEDPETPRWYVVVS